MEQSSYPPIPNSNAYISAFEVDPVNETFIVTIQNFSHFQSNPYNWVAVYAASQSYSDGTQPSRWSYSVPMDPVNYSYSDYSGTICGIGGAFPRVYSDIYVVDEVNDVGVATLGYQTGLTVLTESNNPEFNKCGVWEGFDPNVQYVAYLFENDQYVEIPPRYNGCTDPTSLNYNPNATHDDGSCVAVVKGCMDPNSLNYNPNATQDDGSCVAVVKGCMDPTSLNYNPNATQDDGSCVAVVPGCMDPNSLNYNPNANTDDGSCIPVVPGCMDPTAVNYDPNANQDNGQCIQQSNIPCFKSGTIISTDQGELKIEKLHNNFNKFSINGSEIIGISKTMDNSGCFIKISKDSLENNVPDKDLFLTGDHLVNIDGELVEAKKLVNNTNITKETKEAQYVYNVLLKKHEIISVHNLPVETLNPKNLGSRKIAKNAEKNKRKLKNLLFKR